MVLQVHHLSPADNGDETFVLVERRSRLVPIEGQPDTMQLETNLYRLSDDVALPPPVRWPIPNDRDSNLARSLPWYLEDYLKRPTAGGNVRASFVRKALADWGRELFQMLFHSDEGREAYSRKTGIPFHHDCMIEVISHESSVLSWPWEALIDGDGIRLGRMVAVDRRFYSELPSQTETSSSSDDPLRVLLVSARDGPNDVDYLLVGRLLAARRSIALTCLRPASLEHLAEVLTATDAAFDVVHFDCHGIWADTTGQGEECNLMLESADGGCEPVTAAQIRDVLGSARVPPRHVVLNACRSAMVASGTETVFPSIASMLLGNGGIDDVVAMAYDLPVPAAQAFLRGLYYGLEQNMWIALAVEHGRHALKDDFGSTPDLAAIGQDSWLIPASYRRISPVDDDRPVVLGTGRRAEIEQRAPCIGLDGILWHLDHLGSDIRYVFLLGLCGSGKSVLLDEFLWWRRRSGDLRPSIWIDFERHSCAHDVLAAMARQAGVTGPPQTRSSDLVASLIKRLRQSPHWIIWDHVDAATDREDRGFSNEDLAIMSELLLAIGETPSILLIAGHALDRWLRVPGGFLAMNIRAFPNGWEPLGREEWAHARASEQQPYPADDPDVDNLLFFIAGNVTTVRFAMRAMAGGASAAEVQDELRNGVQGLLRAHATEPAIGRFISTWEILSRDDAVRPLLPFISLHEEIVDPSLLENMMNKVAVTGEAVGIGFRMLVVAGLATREGHLHPMVGAQVRQMVTPDQTTRLAFAEIMHAATTQPLTGARPAITVGSIEQAARILSAAGRMADALMLLERCTDTLTDKGRLDRARDLHRKFIELATTDQDRRLALFAALEYAILTSDGADAEALLADSVLNREPLPGDVRVRLKFERGLVARLRGDRATARQLMKEAIALAGPDTGTALRSRMNAELANTVDPSDVSDAGESAPGHFGHPAGDAGDLRMQAQHLMARRDYRAALRQVERAIAIDKANGRLLPGAMNLSLKGDILGQMKKIDAARKCFEESISIFEQVGARHEAAVSHHQWGAAAYRNDLMEEAGAQLILAASAFKELGAEATVVQITENFGRFVQAEGNEFIGITLANRWILAELPKSPEIAQAAARLTAMFEREDDDDGSH